MLHENEAIAKAKVIESFYSHKIHKYLKSVKKFLDKLVSFAETFLKRGISLVSAPLRFVVVFEP